MTEIHLSEQDRKFIDEQVKAGVYRDADAVVHASLRLLNSDEGRKAELQRLIQVGLDDVAAGRVHHYDSEEDFLKDIRALSAQQKTGTGH
ncbi:putative addiction module antidote protein, family [Agrobacterium sp. DSM 25558]|uniref:type II toxin-antitoxin system ParD family antitoxin n=1 Tax=Agrobacterium sp. DSM 25558 TaxID=1907665 RepID=UPI00097246C9|nr:type II toxin-antitoxin system ParD family antitoxin [Agrobacterium sp. DSM 25558]SCX29822.1 putative addiction module antidote protein, family [Agrobacterium sp. DSM 25558]